MKKEKSYFIYSEGSTAQAPTAGVGEKGGGSSLTSSRKEKNTVVNDLVCWDNARMEHMYGIESVVYYMISWYYYGRYAIEGFVLPDCVMNTAFRHIKNQA